MANVVLRVGTLNNPSKGARDYVYSDINSNLLKNANKTDVLTNIDENAVFGSINNLFNYTPGQRMLLPTYGMDLSSLLYEPMNTKTAESLGVAIQNALTRWEPRAVIKEIEVTPDYDDNTYYIVIKFRIKNLNKNKEFQLTKAVQKRL